MSNNENPHAESKDKRLFLSYMGGNGLWIGKKYPKMSIIISVIIFSGIILAIIIGA